MRREGARYGTGLRGGGWPVFVVTPERAYGPIGPGFHDLGGRREFMAAQGITTQVLCAPPFLFYYWHDAQAAEDIICACGSSRAAACRRPSQALCFGARR